MSQTLNLNQFQQAPILGDTATKVNLNTLSVQIDPNSTNTLLPGDAVKMTTTAGTTILVDKCLATDNVFGYVMYSIKKDMFVAGDNVEVGLSGQILWLQAAGSISRGDYVEYDPSSSLTTGPRVLSTGGVNPVSGVALDNASTGDLLRVIVESIYPLGTSISGATITGSTINSSTIGASSPSTGVFTTLNETTNGDAISALTPGTTVSLNPTLGGLFTLTPAQSATINAASVPANHRTITIEVVTSGTSSYTLTFGTNFKSAGTLATGTVTAKTFLICFQSDGTNWVEAYRTTAL